jgi:hypothetical protein
MWGGSWADCYRSESRGQPSRPDLPSESLAVQPNGCQPKGLQSPGFIFQLRLYPVPWGPASLIGFWLSGILASGAPQARSKERETQKRPVSFPGRTLLKYRYRNHAWGP